jgi:hypothetical protein
MLWCFDLIHAPTLYKPFCFENVYIGHAVGDLLCLLKADIGIVFPVLVCHLAKYRSYNPISINLYFSYELYYRPTFHGWIWVVYLR